MCFAWYVHTDSWVYFRGMRYELPHERERLQTAILEAQGKARIRTALRKFKNRIKRMVKG